MTFDSHSLERLKELGRKLPTEISKSQASQSISSTQPKKQKLHPVELETNPEQLFRELMEISPDGNVPPHLLERLKKLETNTFDTSINTVTDTDTILDKSSQEYSTKESLSLYTEFRKFLLEDDID